MKTKHPKIQILGNCMAVSRRGTAHEEGRAEGDAERGDRSRENTEHARRGVAPRVTGAGDQITDGGGIGRDRDASWVPLTSVLTQSHVFWGVTLPRFPVRPLPQGGLLQVSSVSATQLPRRVAHS